MSATIWTKICILNDLIASSCPHLISKIDPEMQASRILQHLYNLCSSRFAAKRITIANNISILAKLSYNLSTYMWCIHPWKTLLAIETITVLNSAFHEYLYICCFKWTYPATSVLGRSAKMIKGKEKLTSTIFWHQILAPKGSAKHW